MQTARSTSPLILPPGYDAATVDESAPRAESVPSKEHYPISDELVILNQGSFGTIAAPVLEQYRSYQNLFEKDPDGFVANFYPEAKAEAIAALAEYLGTKPENLVNTFNATHGMNIVAQSFDEWSRRDSVVATSLEYGASLRMWHFLEDKEQKARLALANVELPIKDPSDVVAAIEATITPDTRMLFFSHVSTAEGLVLPVKEICEMARAKGILTLVDGAHAVGHIDFNIEDIGADFYAGNLYKWLNAPRGTGFLYARPEVQALIEPLLVSWGYDRSGHCETTSFKEFHSWQGAHDLSAFLAVKDAVEFQKQFDWSAVREQGHELLVSTLRELNSITGMDPIVPYNRESLGQLGAVALPEGTDLDALKSHLNDEKIRVKVGEKDNNGTPLKTLRVTVGPYTTTEDVSKLVGAVRSLFAK